MPVAANLTRGNSITEDIGNEDRQAYHEAVRGVLKEQDRIKKAFYDRDYFGDDKNIQLKSIGIQLRTPTKSNWI